MLVSDESWAKKSGFLEAASERGAVMRVRGARTVALVSA